MGAVVFVQYPMHYLRSKMGVMFLEMLWWIRKVRFVTLLHDINQLRGLGSCVDDALLRRMLALSAVVVAHNESMISWLNQNGVPSEKLVNLGIFDYLASDCAAEEGQGDFRCVTLAGNLGLWGKCPFVRQLRDVTDVVWELYGAGFDPDKSGGPNVHFNGCYPAGEVVRHLTKGFGLIWDGDSVDTCSGGWGEYLRYNNPHKMSMYLAAGLPVIIWDEAAQASFVEKYKVGFTVGSLREIGARLHSMDRGEYMAYEDNARRLAQRIRGGCFLCDALSAAVKILAC